MMQHASEAMFDASDAEFSIILWVDFEPQVVMDHVVLVNEIVPDAAAKTDFGWPLRREWLVHLLSPKKKGPEGP